MVAAWMAEVATSASIPLSLLERSVMVGVAWVTQRERWGGLPFRAERAAGLRWAGFQPAAGGRPGRQRACISRQFIFQDLAQVAKGHAASACSPPAAWRRSPRCAPSCGRRRTRRRATSRRSAATRTSTNRGAARSTASQGRRVRTATTGTHHPAPACSLGRAMRPAGGFISRGRPNFPMPEMEGFRVRAPSRCPRARARCISQATFTSHAHTPSQLQPYVAHKEGLSHGRRRGGE